MGDEGRLGAIRRLRDMLRSVPMRELLLPQGDVPMRAIVLRLLLALVLACILWVRVSADEDPVHSVTYNDMPIHTQISPHYTLFTSLPKGSIHLSALQSALRDAPPPTLSVDLTRITSTAPLTVPVQANGIPPHALYTYSPQDVSVQLETEVSRQFAVVAAPAVYGQPPQGYKLAGISTEPQTVTVSGPSSIVDKVRTVRVPAISVNGLTQTTTLLRAPQLFDTTGNSVNSSVVKINPPQVKVVIQVQPQPFQQLVPVTLKLKGRVKAGYSITSIEVFPQFVQVFSNSSLATAAVTATVSISGLAANHTFSTVQLTAPPGVILQRTEATVTIDVAPISGSAASVAGIVVMNKRPGTTVAVAPPKVTIAYSGPLSALHAASAPVATLDVGQRQPGVYHLTPTIKLAPGLKVVSVTPSSLRVTITAPPQPHVKLLTPTPTPSPRPPPTRTATAVPRRR